MSVEVFREADRRALLFAIQALKNGGRSIYHDDPVGWATNCIEGMELTPYQEDILSRLVEKKRVAVRGPHGLGKTTINAVAILWFAITREQAGMDWKIATTAGGWRQLSEFLWPEVHKWSYKLIPEKIGRDPLRTNIELKKMNLDLTHGSAFAAAASDPAKIEGVHADQVLYIFDESKAIVPGIFDAAEGAFSGSGGEGIDAYALATSTPGSPSGRFYDIHQRKPGYEDWDTRHVTLQEVVDAGRVNEAWAEQRARAWGKDSAVYYNRVLGEFHSDDTNAVIPLGWIEAAVERWHDWEKLGKPAVPGPKTVGVDVAREGTDKTVFALRDGFCITELRDFSKEDTTATAGRAKGILNGDSERTALVDVVGVGGGVFDMLREGGFKVEAFNASEATTKTDRSGELKFLNTRSAAWWNLRELLDPSRIGGSEIMLPDNDELIGDLAAPTYEVLSSGKIQVESKDKIRPRLGKSTDFGDAVIQAFWDGADHSAEGWIGMMKKRQEEQAAAAPAPVADDREALRQAAFRQQMSGSRW